MESHAIAPFRYNFRAPGLSVRGPILFAHGPSSLGQVLIGRSQAGICAIFIDDSADALVGQLTQAFPREKLLRDQAALQEDLHQVIAFLERMPPTHAVDLDIGGTPFQQKVWRALCHIPSGQTCSYTELARQVCRPDAVRAVAGACASNVLAIAIPCHRVVRSDGSITGYRWGIARKRALIEQERRQ
ncbi:methylated-DNA--[protein]-cysteine S-methyltransferase [Allopusillimonas soli]|uniref:methylated-DNA--[protein]-cysteine S-methyltransferase n=2 Tax=Allopusillimonas soli TaxID=659016 RepID=A0A853FAF3_9BURK|nr:methylated-DNA--[protein]-cysteine S-methyltransferase [Allopusillimonas soli]TEA75607.1 methylated-DNA--[protein]-cysteine S-methyltransferase [Allopusillimonas soli]